MSLERGCRSADEAEEFISGLLLGAKDAEHLAGRGDGVLLFDPAHHHAQMPRFHDHGHPLSLELGLQGFGNLDGQTLLNLKPSAERIDHTRNFAQTDNLLARKIADVAPAKKWKEVMFTERKKVDVFYDYHLIVFNREERTVEETVDILLVASGHEPERFFDALRRLEQPIPLGIFAEQNQNLLDEPRQIRRAAVAADLLLVIGYSSGRHVLTRSHTSRGTLTVSRKTLCGPFIVSLRFTFNV